MFPTSSSRICPSGGRLQLSKLSRGTQSVYLRSVQRKQKDSSWDFHHSQSAKPTNVHHNKIMMYNYDDYDHHNYDYDELLWCLKGNFYKICPIITCAIHDSDSKDIDIKGIVHGVIRWGTGLNWIAFTNFGLKSIIDQLQMRFIHPKPVPMCLWYIFTWVLIIWSKCDTITENAC